MLMLPQPRLIARQTKEIICANSSPATPHGHYTQLKSMENCRTAFLRDTGAASRQKRAGTRNNVKENGNQW